MYSRIIERSHAFAINDRGQVVGLSWTSSGDEHAFLWEDGGYTEIGTLGGGESFAYSINYNGQVVGGSDIGGGVMHATLWER